MDQGYDTHGCVLMTAARTHSFVTVMLMLLMAMVMVAVLLR